MLNKDDYSIFIRLYHKNKSYESCKFISVLLDTRDVNLSLKERSTLINKMYEQTGIKKKDDVFSDFFNNIINSKYPPINNILLFIKNLDKIDYNLVINYDFQDIVLGDFLTGFLNLDFNKFIDFFKFFCTFLFIYEDKFNKKDHDLIFNNKLRYDVYLEDKNIAPIDKRLLFSYAEKIYDDEKNTLIEIQKLYRSFVDYVFNNDKNPKLSKLSNTQRFYIFMNTHKELCIYSKEYICDYNLEFLFANKGFTSDLLQEIKTKNSNPLFDENFLINSFEKNDPDGRLMQASSYNFQTNNLYTYFYIILYHIVLNEEEYIKKCVVCGNYFFSNKNTTLYCNGKYNKKMTCKEYGTKTSQKRKETEEPVYKKYRQIYAKKAMAVKRNPDIEYYKTNYEKWKKEAKQFVNDVKSGKKTYDEFDEWLEGNN
jgi:hypothetical protein